MKELTEAIKKLSDYQLINTLKEYEKKYKIITKILKTIDREIKKRENKILKN